MDRVLFDLGIVQIKWYSFLLLVGVFLGILLLIKESRKFKYPKDFIFNMAFWAIIIGFVGARIYYVAFNWNMYASNPISILEVWQGGLAIHGGLIFGVLTIYLYCKKFDVNFIKILDMAVPSVLIGQAIGRWGNFFNMEAHGGMVSRIVLEELHLPNFIIEGMNINGVYYHPTFLYESLWCLLGFIIVFVMRRFKHLKIGMQTCFYLMWYSIGRFFIEAFRTDSLMLGGFKMAQIVSIILIIVSIIGFIIISRKSKYEDLYYESKGV